MKASAIHSPWLYEEMEFWVLLTRGKLPEKYKKETTLYCQGDAPDYVYLIKHGRARITSFQPDGRERQLYIAEKGCIIGERSAVLGQPHGSFAVTIVDSVIYRIASQELLSAMERSFPLCQVVLRMVCKKHDVLYHQLIGVSFFQAQHQIAQVLLNLVRQYGEPTEDGVRIGIRFTHQDVANITGVSRVTVCNTFNMLTDKGILEKRSGRFEILDLERLRNYADPSDQS